MFTKKTLRHLALFFISTLSFFLLMTGFALAGTIDLTSFYSQHLDKDIDQDGNLDLINWRPDGAVNNGAEVIIDEGDIEGMIWSEAFGYINLNPDGVAGGTGVQLTCSNGVGTFSGEAFGENASWVNFDPPGGGLTLDANGQFNGSIWGEITSYISFSCPGANTCVTTDFVCPPGSGGPTGGGGGGGSGGGGGGGSKTAQCTLSASPSALNPGGSTLLSWSSPNVRNSSFLSAELNNGIGSVTGPSGSFIVNPSQTTTYTLTMDALFMRTGTCSATVTVIDPNNPINIDEPNDPNAPSMVSFVKSQYSVSETVGVLEIQLIRTGNVDQATSVDVRHFDISANSPKDYYASAVVQTVTWDPGEGGEKIVRFTVIPDQEAEISEKFYVELFNPVNAGLNISRTDVTVTDDDIDPNTPGIIRFERESYTVYEGDSLLVNVVRIGGSQGPVVASVATADGFVGNTQNRTQVLKDSSRILAFLLGIPQALATTTGNIAVQTLDYVAQAWSVNWNDAQTGNQSIQVQTVDDSISEPDQTFSLVIDSNISGAALGYPAIATVTIIDNDTDEILSGCMDPNAQNYSPSVDVNDPSLCEYVDGVTFGCMDPNAQNFNPHADQSNNSCRYAESGGGLLGINTGNIDEGWLLFGSILSVVGLVSSLPGVASRIGNLILSFLTARKKYRPWGTVYDALTKQPLDPAYVTLFDVEGNEIASAITDPDGRYGFAAQPGTYYLKAQKTHYIFPSHILSGRKKDDLYNDLYFGKAFEITEEDQVVTRNIPMDPESQDWNEQEKRRNGIFSFFSRYDRLFTYIVNILFVVGFAFSIFALVVSPVLYNIIVFALYIVMIILYALGFAPTPAGIIKDARGNSLPFAVVRVFNPNLNKEIAHRVANSSGHYFILVKKGQYYLTVEGRREDGAYEHLYTSDVFTARRGIINKKIVLGNEIS